MSNNTPIPSLLDIDRTPSRIQRSARHILNYPDSIEAATAWRRQLSTCSEEQLLPLLYVANETLQQVARMRSQRKNKQKAKELLEAFASILASGVKEVCARIGGADMVEKVRRTIKIWGDRQVYSARFVGEVLATCEPYRNGGAGNKVQVRRKSSLKAVKDSPEEKSVTDDEEMELFPSQSKRNSLNVEVNIDVDSKEVKDSNQTLSKQEIESDESDIDDDDILTMTKDSSGPSISQSAASGSKSFKALTTNLERLSNLKSNSLISARYPNSFFDTDEVANAVGDDLTKMHEEIIKVKGELSSEQKKIYDAAREKYAIECKLVDYIDWIQEDIEKELESMKKCDELVKVIDKISEPHEKLNNERKRLKMIKAKELEKEAESRALKLAEEKEQERQRHLEEQLKNNKEAKPGMRWNPNTREYEHIDDTNDDWRG